MLSKEAIQEFQEIYHREFGKQLSFDEAYEQATKLIHLYKAVLHKEPIANDKVKP